MQIANPYESPKSNTSLPSASDTYEPKLLSASGRIGRLRYLAYSLVASLVIGVFIAIASLILGGAGESTLLIILGLLYIPLIIYTVLLAKRRLNDLDKSGWWQLLYLVPIVGILLAFYMLLWPGTKGANNYGPQPTKNSALVVVAACLFPIALIGIIAAIGIPAYQDYLQQAQQVLENQQ